MKVDYACLNCKHRFAIEITDFESASSLDAARADTCSECSQRIGTGPVRCRSCGGTFLLAFPHWHVHCDLAGGDCPACGARYESLCIC
jgi:DNA-directed RNA polymerase subunit RPC12/RpoP